MSKKYILAKNWRESCLSSESTFHQISPYIGKMKSSMAKALIRAFSKRGDVILDPFVGSGTIALEALISGRGIIGVDVNPYAVVLTRAKIHAPNSLRQALKSANEALELSRRSNSKISLQNIPNWVKKFYNQATLREIISLVSVLKRKKDYFTLACLLGILHHQRPGFLSYPASHLVPYLRTRKFPRQKFKEMYEYRAVKPRLIAKIERAYKRPVHIYSSLKKRCIESEIEKIKLKRNSVDVIITSPPYMNALSYGRDNRLRLWFLGCKEFHKCDEKTNSKQEFIELIKKSFSLFSKTLKENGLCILVIGQIRQSKNRFNIGKMVIDLVMRETKNFRFIKIIEDSIPNIRRSRRACRGTKKEWIIIFKKSKKNEKLIKKTPKEIQ